MPTYEYTCTTCGHDLEAVQKFTDDPLTECPECGGPLRKVYGAVGIVLKGSGFYKTDSRAANGNGNGKPSEGDSSSKSDSSSGKSDSSSGKSDSSSKSSETKGDSSSGSKEAKPAASATSSSSS